MNKTTADHNREIASGLSNNLPRMLREFSRDFEQRIYEGLCKRGHSDIRASHSAVLANLGMGAMRVTELAELARVTQQAMGKMLKELERLGYVVRDVDDRDKRARAIKLTAKGQALTRDTVAVVKDVRQHYAARIGNAELDQLEISLRQAMVSLQLDYLPSSWLKTPVEQ